LPSYLCLAGLLTLLFLAALNDLRERRIPNWLSAGTVALYPVYLLVTPHAMGWLAALGLALLVGVIGLGLFARELIGGGDVKLITAVTLWAGLDYFAVFALVTALTGGVLGLGALWYQRWSPMIQAHLAGLGLATADGRSERPVPAGAEPSAGELALAATAAPVTLPYGIAIAAGGVAVVIELLKL
jgi:prepilin peptidase CpaA